MGVDLVMTMRTTTVVIGVVLMAGSALAAEQTAKEMLIEDMTAATVFATFCPTWKLNDRVLIERMTPLGMTTQSISEGGSDALLVEKSLKQNAGVILLMHRGEPPSSLCITAEAMY